MPEILGWVWWVDATWGVARLVRMAPPPPTLHIRVLGDLDLRLEGIPLPPLDSARAVSLLGYLLVHRGVAQPRQRLAFLLWPDSTESQARTNLRHVLHTLRRALPDPDQFIESTSTTLRWRVDAPCHLDLADFEHALTGGDLAAAVEAYGGDLLEASYDDWVVAEREVLRVKYVGALERLGLQLEEAGEWDAAVRCAERLVRCDPLGEDGHRALIRLHAARGEPARALRAYHAYAELLQRELGVEPSPETRATYEALLAVDAEPLVHSPSIAGPPLVGRVAERARLNELWRAANRDGARLVLVSGEPGIGKTRLVEELMSWCARAGAITAEARAYPAEGAVAFGPVAAWLRTEPFATRLRRLDAAHLTELARVLPELLAEVPDLRRPAPLPEDEQRQLLYAALTRALLVPNAPLLLVADDVQWFDRSTLQYLHYLLRAQATAPLLVAATVRREDIDGRHPVGELVTGLQTLGRFAEIEFGRLSRAETGALAAGMTGAPLRDDDVDRLFADSEGNPLFLVEAVQATSDAGAGARPATAARVQAVIASRLARLSDAAGELAGVAAAIGREFSAPVLADASGVDDRALARGLDELWRRGIVRAQALDAYDFSHGRIREAAYDALSPAQRRHHHLRIAGALERAHGADLDAAAGPIAAHYDTAGAAGEAATWYVRAADTAQRLHDHTGAARALERARTLCRELPPSRHRNERELAILTALPAPLNALDGYRSPRLDDVHERALTVAAQLGVEPQPPLVRSMAVAALTAGDFAAARAVGEQLRTRGARDGDSVLAVEGEWVLAIAAYWTGELEPARRHLERALEQWRPEHRSEHLLRYGQDTELVCRIRLAHTLWLLGHEEESRHARDTTVASADARGHPHSRALVHVFAGVIAVDARDEAALRTHTSVLAAFEGGPAGRPAAALAGLVDVLDGRAEHGLAEIERVVDDGERRAQAAPGEQGLLTRVLVEACAIAGDARAGLAAADRALQTGNRAQPWTTEIERMRALFLRAPSSKRSVERLGNGWSRTMPPTPHERAPDHSR